MTRRPPTLGSDLRGAARLATDATRGLTALVEAMHERIARMPGSQATPHGRTTGVTGLVYRSVRGVTRLAGGSVDALLGLLAPLLATPALGREREAVVAALNGVVGDHLAETDNPLATTMGFRREGRPLDLDPSASGEQRPDGGDALLILVHGLCMNDLQWHRQGHDHGAALARDAGWTPVHLRYNSGRRIATNGADFAARLQRLVDAWPVPLRRLAIVGHSMGGLVARSAIHHAEAAGMPWRAQLGDLVCLGTPHLGAPLERAGHGVDLLLGAVPYAAPMARLARVRSAGIVDLRHGNVLGDDEAHRSLPLPAGVRCHAVAGVLGEAPTALSGRLLGDGLVPLDSALGRSRDRARDLGFQPERLAVIQGIGHLDLLASDEVCAALLRWLGTAPPHGPG